MTATPDYSNPPIVEMILGVQFSPLTKLTAGHFGIFWRDFGEDWIEPADAPLIDDQFELFDPAKWSTPGGLHLRLEPVRLPGRFTLGHKGGDRLVQLQATRFHLNWRKREQFYPSYKRLISEFEGMFSRFTGRAEKLGLGPVAVNQWELTYIDAFHQEEYWTTPADWADILPGLFGPLFPTEGAGVALERRTAEWSYEIQPRRGRLHVAAGPGRVGGEERDALLLQMTARGPVGKGGVETLRAGLDLGHDIAFETFLRVTSEVAKKKWEPTP